MAGPSATDLRARMSDYRRCGLIESSHYTPETSARPKGRAFLLNRYRCRSLYVSPVLAFEQVREHDEEGQIQQYVDPDAMTRLPDRIGGVAEEADQIAYGGLVLFCRLGTCTLFHYQYITLFGEHGLACQGVANDLAVLFHRHRGTALDRLALQLGQYVRHTDVLEHRVVPAKGAR